MIKITIISIEINFKFLLIGCSDEYTSFLAIPNENLYSEIKKNQPIVGSFTKHLSCTLHKCQCNETQNLKNFHVKRNWRHEYWVQGVILDFVAVFIRIREILGKIWMILIWICMIRSEIFSLFFISWHT